MLRVLALCFLVYCLSAPPKRLVTLGPPQVVATANPLIGVHTRLTDEVEEWKVQRTFQMVREMGSPWAVEYFPWAYYEPAQGHYEWTHPDMVVRHAANQGVRLIARIDFVPEWARPADTTFRYLDPDHYQDYADFVGAFVRRYKGTISHVIIWNEPNLAFEWGYRQPDPAAYTELLRLAYLAAKAADPDVLVLAAGLAPTLAPPGSEWGMDDLIYLQRMYDSGAADWLDGLAIHAYGLTSPPDEPADPEQVNFSRAELLRGVMVANGDADKPAYITEGGWNDHPRWARAVRPYQRIEYTVRAYQKALEEWPWCRAVALWAFRFPWPQHTYQDYYAFVSPEFVAKPVYQDVRNYALGLPYEYLEAEP